MLLGRVYLEFMEPDPEDPFFEVYYFERTRSLVAYYESGDSDRLDYEPLSVEDALWYLYDRYFEGSGYVFVSFVGEVI